MKNGQKAVTLALALSHLLQETEKLLLSEEVGGTMEDGRERGGDDARPPKLLDEEQFGAEVTQIRYSV
uniref:Uncharacterized protein n=1 Tax=Rhizophora mucronata TaxID=61149 RepID=A0A2P2NAI7_RHIMU